jgi:hypothetical protein
MTSNLPTIASFWFGSGLSWLEALCIKSYLDHGHRFVLYALTPLAGVPEGTELRDAREILWPPPFDISDNDRQRVAVFSDIFRLRMIRQTGFVWVDCDALCVRPFDFASPWIFADAGNGRFANGVIGLPAESRTLDATLTFLETPNPTQPWRGARLHRKNLERRKRGETWGIESLSWGSSGPKAFTYFLKSSGEERFALPTETLYPLPVERLNLLHDPHCPTEMIERAGVHSVHVYGHQKKFIALRLNGMPVPGSYLDRICRRHGINAASLPVQQLEWMVRSGRMTTGDRSR